MQDESIGIGQKLERGGMTSVDGMVWISGWGLMNHTI